MIRSYIINLTSRSVSDIRGSRTIGGAQWCGAIAEGEKNVDIEVGLASLVKNQGMKTVKDALARMSR
jgi:hypothetical protein